MALDPFDPLTSLKQQIYCNIQERNFSHKFDKKKLLTDQTSYKHIIILGVDPFWLPSTYRLGNRKR